MIDQRGESKNGSDWKIGADYPSVMEG